MVTLIRVFFVNTCTICFNIIFSFHLQNSIEEEEIERLIRESDGYMVPRGEPMTPEFDEETRSFPSQKCLHLFYSAEALQNHNVTLHGNIKRFSCRNCNKEFRKGSHKLLHEGHCRGVLLKIFWI